MKARILLSTIIPLLISPGLYADYPDTILNDAPIAYYRFEEPVGSTAIADSSGNDLSGTVTAGAVTFETDGLFGNAGAFAGDSSILTALAFDPSVGDFSIEAIINPTTLEGTQVFVANQDGAGGGLGRSALITLAEGVFRSFIGGVATDTVPVFQLDTWIHLILTYDRSAADLGEDTIRLYVEGELLASSTVVAEFADGGWVIGSHKLQDNSFFNGQIDELSFWDFRLDDPDGDGDTADSLVTGHYKEYLAAADVIVTFDTDTEFVMDGGSATLSWSVSPALTELIIDDGSGPVDVLADTVDCIGSRVVAPAQTTTYTLSGTSPAGVESLEITIVVDAPPIIDSFTSNFSEVQVGTAAELSWEVRNATSVEIDNGVGVVDPVSGTTTVTVAAETTYTLTATNMDGAVSAEVTVGVSSSDPTLVAHWRVGEAPGETAGTTLVSETGAMFDGTFVGTPAFDTTDPAPANGGSSASIVFDGASSVDILGWTGIAGTSSRTVAFWFKGPATQPVNNATLISWGSGATSMRFDTRLSNNNRGGTMRTEVAGSGRDSSLFVADDTWRHAAVVIVDDGSPNIGEALFYVDGVLDGAAVGGTTPIDTASADPVRIGDANRFARALTGKMDDIRIYSRALTGEEILELTMADEVDFAISSIEILESGAAEIRWTAPPGEYAVDFSFDLVGWSELDDTSIPPGESSAVTIDNVIATNPDNTRVYYRIKVLE